MILYYRHTANVKNSLITGLASSMRSYAHHLNTVAELNNYEYPESSINLPFDNDLVSYTSAIKKKLVTNKLKYIIVVGIGGSNLGTKAIYDALFGSFDVIEPGRYPKVLFADTNDTDYVYKLAELIRKLKSPEEVIINAVSKTGTTTETIVNLEILLANRKDLKGRLVITTDYESDLWHKAKTVNVLTIPIPKTVGGRYSVFSAVGLFPLMCAGLDIVSLYEGAMEMRSKCLSKEASKNPALLSAVALFVNYKDKKPINNNFFFHPELESLGKWYQQLMAESIGKEGVGITPTVSIGSTDLHSMLQLYLGGPKDKFFTFITTSEDTRKVKISDESYFPLALQELKGKSTREVMNAILDGVKQTFEKENVPFMEVQLRKINEKSLGKYMQFKMIEMMFLGQLLNVNPFDQPDVESYKAVTKDLLLK